jgi:hypothetical protein
MYDLTEPYNGRCAIVWSVVPAAHLTRKGPSNCHPPAHRSCEQPFEDAANAILFASNEHTHTLGKERTEKTVNEQRSVLPHMLYTTHIQ